MVNVKSSCCLLLDARPTSPTLLDNTGHPAPDHQTQVTKKKLKLLKKKQTNKTKEIKLTTKSVNHQIIYTKYMYGTYMHICTIYMHILLVYVYVCITNLWQKDKRFFVDFIFFFLLYFICKTNLQIFVFR